MKIYVLYARNNGSYDLYNEEIVGFYLAKGNAERDAKDLKEKEPKDVLGFDISYEIEEYETKD